MAWDRLLWAEEWAECCIRVWGSCVYVYVRCVAVCSLGCNNIGDEGAAAISHGLGSVPQLQTLEYVLWKFCLLLWTRLRGTLWRGAGCDGRAVCVAGR